MSSTSHPVSLIECLALAALPVSVHGSEPKVDGSNARAIDFMRRVAQGESRGCSHDHFRRICSRLLEAAPYYTEYLANLAQILCSDETLSPLRMILEKEIRSSLPCLRERMYETGNEAVKRYPGPVRRQEDTWTAYVAQCLKYEKLDKLVGEAVLQVFGLPESPEHRLCRARHESAACLGNNEELEWRQMVFEYALAAMGGKLTNPQDSAPVPVLQI